MEFVKRGVCKTITIYNRYLIKEGMTKNLKVYMNVKVDENLKKKAQKHAIDKGIDLGMVIEDAMRAYPPLKGV